MRYSIYSDGQKDTQLKKMECPVLLHVGFPRQIQIFTALTICSTWRNLKKTIHPFSSIVQLDSLNCSQNKVKLTVLSKITTSPSGHSNSFETRIANSTKSVLQRHSRRNMAQKSEKFESQVNYQYQLKHY